jgi:hypothetical protein
VTFFVMGLLTGMIVAFASCSADVADAPAPPHSSQHGTAE